MSASTATISRAAIAHNVAVVAACAPGADLCAVVKADGYGHGAVDVARTALAAGATWLAVAQVDEARRLRAAGINDPILVLSECATEGDQIDRALAAGLHLVAYRPVFIDAVAARAEALGIAQASLHLKIDTGMGRVGAPPTDTLDLARRIEAHPSTRLAGTMTHLAVADEPDNVTTDQQLARFRDVLGELTRDGIDPGIRHAANSAGTLAHPGSHFDLVRVGIALYGIAPGPALEGAVDLRPALRWTTTVRLVKDVAAGDAVSYGHRHVYPRDTTVATIGVGYADGYARRLGLAGGAVLIGGRRCPIVGVVTMDQFVVDVAPVLDAGRSVAVGDEVVLVGSQGEESITANALGALVDTIGYEVTCAIGNRVARVAASDE